MASPRQQPASIKSKASYHHGDLRSQLIKAARQLVINDGADQFKLSAACRLAGVSTAAPYRHFSDRDKLLDAVIIEGFHDLESMMRQSSGEHEAGSYEAISAIGSAYVEFARAQPNLFRVMFANRQGCNSDETRQAGQRAFRVLLEQVAAFQKKTRIDDTVSHAALPLWTLVHGLSFILIDNNLGLGDQPLDIPNMVARHCRQLLV